MALYCQGLSKASRGIYGSKKTGSELLWNRRGVQKPENFTAGSLEAKERQKPGSSGWKSQNPSLAEAVNGQVFRDNLENYQNPQRTEKGIPRRCRV